MQIVQQTPVPEPPTQIETKKEEIIQNEPTPASAPAQEDLLMTSQEMIQVDPVPPPAASTEPKVEKKPSAEPAEVKSGEVDDLEGVDMTGTCYNPTFFEFIKETLINFLICLF